MNPFQLVTLYGRGRWPMSGRRKPKVINRRNEFILEEKPPPTPPEYELVEAWSPDERVRSSRGTRISLIISSIALFIAMLSLIAILAVLSQNLNLFRPVTTTYTTTTLTTFYTTTITTTSVASYTTTYITTTVATTTVPEYCPFFSSDSDIDYIAFNNMMLTRNKINITITINLKISLEKLHVNNKNFSIVYTNYDNKNETKSEYASNVNIVNHSLYSVNFTITDPPNWIRYIVDIKFNKNDTTSCIIARFYGP